MVRLFIAVEIEDSAILNKVIIVRDRVRTCSSEIDLKAVENENLHITLRFIGEVSEFLVQDIVKAMECVSVFKKFNIKLKGVGAFPTVSRPRVVWLGVSEGVTQLRLIRDCIERGLRKLGIQAEREEFIPHITLARIKSFRSSRCLSDVFTELGDFEVGVTPVTMVRLKKSTLTPKGPIYSDVFEVRLAD